jgi:hypothetical protein
MSRKSVVFSALSLGLLCAAFGCSEDEGSTVSDKPSGSAGTKASGGSGGGSVLTPKAGSSGSGGTGSGVISSEACPGLPIDPIDEPSSSGGAAASSAGAGGAPSSEEPSAGSGGELIIEDPSAGAGAGAGGAPIAEYQSSAGAGGEEAGACVGVSLEAEAVPVDLFIMMDRSQSMGYLVEGSSMTRWEALRDAVQGFVQDPAAADVRMGLGFFSLTGTGNDELDCDVDAYAEPNVPIGLLSEIGEDLVSAIEDVTPAGLTPTVPAIEGAITYARAWATDHPERATLVALVTDGYPTQCGSAPEAIAAAAKNGYQSPQHIRTFVIGVGDVAKFNLDTYARAGGTGKPFLTDSGDVTSSFVEALGNITNRDLACEYQLPTPPSGMKLDTTKVQVVYTPATGSPEEVPSIQSLGACANNPNGGWYYDDANNPSKITVCPCTCARFQAGQVDVRLGCKPRLGLR